MSDSQSSTFLRRFDRIWSQARRVQLSQALCWSVLTALGGISLIAVVDYAWELPRSFRVAGMVATIVAVVVVAVSLTAQSIRRWQRNRTAAAIERFFPQLHSHDPAVWRDVDLLDA